MKNRILFTLVPHLFGNAICTNEKPPYFVVTDYGNSTKLSEDELKQFFEVGPVAPDSHKHFTKDPEEESAASGWGVEVCNIGEGCMKHEALIVFDFDKEEIVCSVSPAEGAIDQDVRNAFMISAAPEMFVALETLVEEYKIELDEKIPYWKAANEALIKALGVVAANTNED